MSTTLFAKRCLGWTFGSQCLSLQMKSIYSSLLLNKELSSLLFIPGDMAHKVVSILKPAVSFDIKDEDIEIMNENIKSRRLTCNFDLLILRTNFQHLETLRSQVKRLKAEESKSKKKAKETHESKLEEVQAARKVLRELTKTVSHIEESVLPQLLLLPNRLLKETPKSENCIIYEFNKPSHFNFDVASHETLGRKSKTIVFNSLVGPRAYYFMGALARFEQVTIDYFQAQFKAKDFVASSNPDFTKSIVVEGCGLSFSDPVATFHLERDKEANVNIPVDLHLTGSTSFMAFCSFYSKTNVKVVNLPLKYYAMGRRYNPVLLSTINNGLFTVPQNTELSIFIATQDEREAAKEYDAVLQVLNSAFEKLKLHFRMIAVSAPNLSLSESRRTEVQMWSPAHRSYFTVSHVSLHDDFISRRLLMLYEKEKGNINYLHVVSGTAISIPPFVACVIENLQTETQSFTLPLELLSQLDELKNY